jgi:hypothetical protein
MTTGASAKVVDDVPVGGVDGMNCEVAQDAHYIDFGLHRRR